MLREIDSLLTPIVESTYLNRDMCKFESSPKGESRWQSTDSSKAYRNTRAFEYLSAIVDVIKFLAVNELSFRATEEDLGSLHSGLLLQLMELSSKKDENCCKFPAVSQIMRSTLVQKSKMM